MTQKFKTLADCVALAEFAHRNQQDKAGFPYIDHPRRVLANVQQQGAPPYTQMAAILHDVTEDTAFTCTMLLDLGVPEAAVNIVRLVDRDASQSFFEQQWKFSAEYEALMNEPLESYEDPQAYIARATVRARDKYYYKYIRTSPEAVKVKLADIGDNLQPWRLSYLPPETQERLRKKYATAVELLTGSADG